jgi:carboxylesterase type B
MDLVAGVHWLHENLRAFGGDPERVSLLGHGTGAALANFLAVSPMAKGKKALDAAACKASITPVSQRVGPSRFRSLDGTV